ncbi:MAG: hypothetical protein JWM76_4471 [Pseudonocardiales bacterium]|nr:hypothetical protein [Pseudonocardiales bacterium]
MSLQDTWSKAWRTKYGLPLGWLVNLEPTQSVPLGEVGVVDDGHLAHETTLEQRGVNGLSVDPDSRRDDSEWQFASNEGISVDLSSAGKTDGPVAAIGKANWKLDLSFGAESGAASYGTAMWWTRYSDLGRVRSAVVEAAEQGRLHKGESIVVEQQVSGKGVLFLSQGSHGSLGAEANIDVKPGAVPSIASLSGLMHVSHSSGAAAAKSFSDGSVLAFRSLVLGTRGFFWWRQFEAFGALPTDPDELEEITLSPVEGEGDNEYFALL